jgi:glycosyltransferase involved in cell wall biosynthesis
MKIMHLVSVWDGGVKNQVLSVSKQMAARGEKVMVLALSNKCDERNGVTRDVPVIELVRKKTLLDLFSSFTRARALVHSFEPDVVHAHSFHAIVFARLLRLVAKCPYLVSTFHTSNNAANVLDGGALYSAAYRLTDPLTDISTNVSRESSESFVRSGAVSRNRVVTVFDGIDTKKFDLQPQLRKEVRRQLNIDENAFVWLAVGRLSAPKDYPTLFAAFGRIANSVPGCLLAVVGDGPLESQLRKEVVEMGLDGRIHFLGRRDDVPRLMNAADAYVLSSAWEGFPNAAAEAMASALPVVATDCGGVRELVADCGSIVPARDPEALAAKMRDISALTAKDRRAFGMKARCRVCDLFSLQRCCDDWLALYSARVRRASDWNR